MLAGSSSAGLQPWDALSRELWWGVGVHEAGCLGVGGRDCGTQVDSLAALSELEPPFLLDALSPPPSIFGLARGSWLPFSSVCPKMGQPNGSPGKEGERH